MCSVDPIFFSQGLQVLPLFAQRKGFWASLVSGTLGGVSCLLSAISFPVTRAASYAWTSIESVQGRAGSRRLFGTLSPIGSTGWDGHFCLHPTGRGAERHCLWGPRQVAHPGTSRTSAVGTPTPLG